MIGKGIAGDIQINWPDLMAFKRSFTDPIPEKREHLYAHEGIDAFHGRIRFTDRNKLDVEGNTLLAEHVLIAGGAEPIRLGIPGEEHLITYEEFLTLQSLPRRIVFVGGGYIAAEFSTVAALAGADVTVLQRGDRMLMHFDEDLVGWLMDKFDQIGIDVHTATTVRSVERTVSRPVRRTQIIGSHAILGALHHHYVRV
jgi:glutathione reductase (NADPH)